MFCFLLPLSHSFKGVKGNHSIIFMDNYQVKLHANSAGMSCDAAATATNHVAHKRPVWTTGKLNIEHVGVQWFIGLRVHCE